MASIRPRPHVSGYFWIRRNFFFSDTATVHTHPVNSIANSNIVKSALQILKKNKSATNPIACGQANLDIFESNGVANSSPISYRTINQYGGTTATTGQICRHYHALYGLCSDHILLQRSPGYYNEFGLHRMRVDMRIRLECAMCGRGNFWIRKEKLTDSKISGYVWTGPKSPSRSCYHFFIRVKVIVMVPKIQMIRSLNCICESFQALSSRLSKHIIIDDLPNRQYKVNPQNCKNVKCQMFVYSGHALSYTKLVHRHTTPTERNKYFKWT